MDLDVTPDLLRDIGECIIRNIVFEAKKDFAKRGWSGKDPMGGPDLWDSFSYTVKSSSVEIHSTFYGMYELITGDIPERKMTWLTQQGQGRNAEHKKLANRRYGRGKTPLVVPLTDRDTGQVVFRTAPFRTKDAWIHPGIAKFTFIQRAIRKAREECMVIMADHVRDVLRERLS